MGKRVDIIILFAGIIFVLEFKVGETVYSKASMEQVFDYELDLKNFHEQSHERIVVPIVVSTEAPDQPINIKKYDDGVYHPIKTNKNNLVAILLSISNLAERTTDLIPAQWINSIYKPTPTIVEAAQALYKGHSVTEISRSDSGAINLGATSATINKIILSSKENKKKSICFITGVPGAGKTLAGLNIANERHDIDEGEHAVFLSGNGPLVSVLQEALARNEVLDKKNTNEQVTKVEALAKTKAFIQNIHHFRDDALRSELAPIEKVVVF